MLYANELLKSFFAIAQSFSTEKRKQMSAMGTGLDEIAKMEEKFNILIIWKLID